MEFLKRAQREPPGADERPAILLELGTAAARAGASDGIALLRDAFALAEAQPVRAVAGLELAFALGVSSTQSIEAIPVLDRAREGLEDPDLLAFVDASLVMFAICVPSTRPGLSAQLLEVRRRSLELRDGAAQLALLAALSIDLIFEGAPATEIAARAQRSLAGGRLMRHDLAHEGAFALAAVQALTSAGELDAAKRALDDGVGQARERGSAYGAARILSYRAMVHLRLGDLPAAESDAESTLSVDAAWGIPHAFGTAIRAAARIERGDLDGAAAALAALDPDPALLEVSPNQIVREVRATLSLAAGRPQEALEELCECARWERESGLEQQLGPVCWRSLGALAQLQLGETGEAQALAADELALARSFGAAPQIGNALRRLGTVLGKEGGAALLEEAVIVLGRSPARLDHARALIDHGALLRRCGQRSAATAQLRAGMDLAHRCAATALVDAAATELRLAGARPRRIALSGRASLTPGERRVAELAAEGLSNKQIAQALFVTLRTVEMHLSNSYRKLAISSREQLPAALRRD